MVKSCNNTASIEIIFDIECNNLVIMKVMALSYAEFV